MWTPSSASQERASRLASSIQVQTYSLLVFRSYWTPRPRVNEWVHTTTGADGDDLNVHDFNPIVHRNNKLELLSNPLPARYIPWDPWRTSCTGWFEFLILALSPPHTASCNLYVVRSCHDVIINTERCCWRNSDSCRSRLHASCTGRWLRTGPPRRLWVWLYRR